MYMSINFACQLVYIDFGCNSALSLNQTALDVNTDTVKIAIYLLTAVFRVRNWCT